jgi:hypothetical protein
MAVDIYKIINCGHESFYCKRLKNIQEFEKIPHGIKTSSCEIKTFSDETIKNIQ